VPLRDVGLARLDALAARLPRQILRRYRAIAMHEDDERLPLLVLHDQGLHDLVLRHIQ